MKATKTKLHRAKDRIEQFSPERRARVERGAQRWELNLRLAEIREMLRRTQKQVAEALGITQPAISKMEHQEDMKLSTMASYVSALGGRLEVSAAFEDFKVPLMTSDDGESPG